MNGELNYKLFFILIVILFFNFPLVSAVNIGISPSTLTFRNMLRGGYSERLVTVTLGTVEDTEVTIKARGDIKDWLEFSVSKFNVSKDNLYILKVIVKPPADIPNGDYTGFIRFTTSPLSSATPEQAAGIVRASVDVAVTVNIIDTEIISCRASQFNVKSAEEGEQVEFTLTMINDGNIRLKPKVTIDIWDQEHLKLVKFVEFREVEILPTVQKNIIIKVPTDDLPIGQYWVDVTTVDCFASDTLTFDVLEPGTLRAQGTLNRITGKVWARVGETIPIVVFFSNIGEKQVVAQFKGKITLGGRIIKVLEGETLEVPIGDEINFTMFFTPQEVGRYIASGRVFYENKRTYESSTVINVEPKQPTPINMKIVYVIIIVIIMILFYKVRKERKKYMNELKELYKIRR